MLIAWLADRHSHKQWQYMRLVFLTNNQAPVSFLRKLGLGCFFLFVIILRQE